MHCCVGVQGGCRRISLKELGTQCRDLSIRNVCGEGALCWLVWPQGTDNFDPSGPERKEPFPRLHRKWKQMPHTSSLLFPLETLSQGEDCSSPALACVSLHPTPRQSIWLSLS